MDAAGFARKWIASKRTERAASQEHFLNLCALLDEETPNDADPTGDFYAFEKGAERTSAGDGFADVWLKDHFGWEYKGKRKDLRAAYKQLLDYHEALGQPPLLVVCDLERFEVHTKWTGFESWTYKFDLTDLTSDEPVRVTTSRDEPASGAQELHRHAGAEGPLGGAGAAETRPHDRADHRRGGGAVRGRRRRTDASWGNTDDMGIARFVSRTVFCMFASDIGLLPRGAFSDLLRAQAANPGQFREALADLFRIMESGGRYGAQTIPWINGDLFNDYDVPEDLTTNEILKLQELDALNWADVEPAIFGTLFERILDKDARAALGAHYTSRTDIETLVEPVLMAPLRRDWEAVREAATEARYQADLHGAAEETQLERIREHVGPFLDRLTTGHRARPRLWLRKLPLRLACPAEGTGEGSDRLGGPAGRALRAPRPPAPATRHRDQPLRPRARRDRHLDRLPPVEAAQHHPPRQRGAHPPKARPDHPHGRHRRPLPPRRPPRTRVAPRRRHRRQPPVPGGKKLRRELGDEYVEAMFGVWEGRVRRTADLCCYWHEKARRMVHAGRAKRAGLLATQAIRGAANRGTLERIKESGDIFFAVSNREWILDGAAVRIAMVGFDDGSETRHILDGQLVAGINFNLTTGLPLMEAVSLRENKGVGFMGVIRIGPFEIDGQAARRMLAHPNPDGRDNADVVRPWWIAEDLIGRPRDMWIVDFPPGTELAEAELYEAPFSYLSEHVHAVRASHKQKKLRDEWWILGAARAPMRTALERLPRFLATPLVSKHRVFAWLEAAVLPDARLIVFARDDDYFLGVLQSRLHELWALGLGARHGVGNDPTYNNTTCFQTFPLPWPPGDEPADSPLVEAVAEAARRLNELREGWLNPEGPLVGADELKRRTLTNLYNERPAWLDTAHRRLDEAVFNAYGWPPGLSDDEVLARLLALNQERAAAQG